MNLKITEMTVKSITAGYSCSVAPCGGSLGFAQHGRVLHWKHCCQNYGSLPILMMLIMLMVHCTQLSMWKSSPCLKQYIIFFPCQLDKHKLDFFNYIIDFSSCLAIEIRRKQWMFSSSLTLKKKCLKISLWDGHLVLQDASPSRPVLLTVNSVFAWD